MEGGVVWDAFIRRAPLPHPDSMWTPFGIEPIFWITFCAEVVWFSLFLFSPIPWWAWLAGSLAIPALVLYYMQGMLRSKQAALLARHTNARKPSAILYIPGLGAPAFTGYGFNWLWGGDAKAAPPVYPVSVPARQKGSPHINLGDEAFVQDVLAEWARLVKTLGPNAQIALVGSSRGTHVALRILAEHGDLLKPHLHTALLLCGPMRNVKDAVEHRLGVGLAGILLPWIYRVASPLTLEHLPTLRDPWIQERLLIVATQGDAVLNHEDMVACAVRNKARHLVLGPTTPHSLAFASLPELERLQDWVVGCSN